MSATETDVFESLSQHSENPSEMIDAMVDYFRTAEKPQELFEALKMRIRQQLNLPLLPGENEKPRPEDVDQQLELGLLEACREAGKMLIDQGRVGEGWMYLRPTGDTEAARKWMAGVEITDDNYDEMIQVLLHEGVDVARGYQAVLDHQGTCNSITLYEQALVNRSKADRMAAASCLLEHFYDELSTIVRADITKRDKPPADDETLFDMIEKRKWVLEEGGYHLDTTHLSATVKIAALLEDPAQLRKAWELCQYGRRLQHEFQYPGEEPFLDFYPAHLAFFSILLGEDVEAGLRLFQRKAKSVDPAQHGTGAIEAYVDLLDRLGRPAEAIEAAVQLAPDDMPPQRIIPLLIDMLGRVKEARAEVAQPVLEYCKKHNDVLGYAAILEAAGGET